MKATGKPNINSRTYWNSIYGNGQKRAEYQAQGTTFGNIRGVYIRPTMRFETALKKVRDGDRVLDIGCGVGNFTELVYLKKQNCEVWGVDISDAVIEENKKINPKVNYLTRSVGHLDGIPENYFDLVFSGETLEHLDDPSSLVRDAHRVLKKGGLFVLTTPRDNHIESEEHVWYFTVDDIGDLMHTGGFGHVKFVNLPDIEHVYVIFAIGKKT